VATEEEALQPDKGAPFRLHSELLEFPPTGRLGLFLRGLPPLQSVIGASSNVCLGPHSISAALNAYIQIWRLPQKKEGSPNGFWKCTHTHGARFFMRKKFSASDGGLAPKGRRFKASPNEPDSRIFSQNTLWRLFFSPLRSSAWTGSTFLRGDEEATSRHSSPKSENCQQNGQRCLHVRPFSPFLIYIDHISRS